MRMTAYGGDLNGSTQHTNENAEHGVYAHESKGDVEFSQPQGKRSCPASGSEQGR